MTGCRLLPYEEILACIACVSNVCVCVIHCGCVVKGNHEAGDSGVSLCRWMFTHCLSPSPSHQSVESAKPAGPLPSCAYVCVCVCVRLRVLCLRVFVSF